MIVEYAMLSRIADYLRINEDFCKAILPLGQDDYYFYNIIKQKEQTIQTDTYKIYQFHYQMTLPQNYWKFQQRRVSENVYLHDKEEKINFIISCRTKIVNEMDKTLISYLHKHSKLEKDGLSALLLIMSLLNWHIGIYPDNKGEKKE